MKKQKVLVEFELGPVIDECEVTHEEVALTMETLDKNNTTYKVVGAYMEDVDTGRITNKLSYRDGLIGNDLITGIRKGVLTQ